MLMCVLRRARPRRVALTARTESRHLRCVFFKLCVRYRRRGLGAPRALYMVRQLFPIHSRLTRVTRHRLRW